MSGVDVLGVIRTLMSVVRTDNGNLHKEINDLLEEADEAAAAVSKMVTVLREVNECAAYWSEYDVPIGIHDRIKSALAAFGGSDEN